MARNESNKLKRNQSKWNDTNQIKLKKNQSNRNLTKYTEKETKRNHAFFPTIVLHYSIIFTCKKDGYRKGGTQKRGTQRGGPISASPDHVH